MTDNIKLIFKSLWFKKPYAVKAECLNVEEIYETPNGRRINMTPVETWRQN